MAHSFGNVALALALVGAAAAQAAEAPYPVRPVRLVVPYPPGGATDFTAREISQKLSEALGQQFVVDNRSGAGGTVGHQLVTKAAPDGYTLVVGTFGGLVSGPALMGERLPYDPVKDLVPVGLAVYTPWALLTNPNVPAKSVKELIDLARASDRHAAERRAAQGFRQSRHGASARSERARGRDEHAAGVR